MGTSNSIGSQAERIAESHLLQNGLKTLARNFSCRLGELDLIMQDGDDIVFVEVRYRSSDRFGGPIASVDFKKQKKLWAAAETYLQKNPKLRKCNQRFDVIGVAGNMDNSKHSIEWLQNAITDL